MKAIIIARVSTEEQENSPEAQLYRMREYCGRNNFEIIQEFNFIESAYKSKRDVFDKTLEFLDDMKEKIVVCFDKVDRLSRNIFDKRVALLYEKAVSNNIELHFVSDLQVINDKMNAGDKFNFGVKLGLSKYYSDAISDNVKRTFEQKRRNGEWTGPVRLGYLNVSLDAEKRLRKDIIIDPARGPLIVKMYEMYATGQYSLESIRIEITRLGLRTLKGNELSKSGTENILKESFYYGIARPKKYSSYQHKYPRLIHKDLYDRCQEVRERRNNKSKTRGKEFIFGDGLLLCAICGCVISFEEKIKPNGTIFRVGACTNSKRFHDKKYYVNEKNLLIDVYKVLDAFKTIPESTLEGLVGELRSNVESEVVYHKSQIVRINTEYENLKAKDDRLLDTYLDQGITKDIYDKKHQEYADKIQLLEIERSEHTSADYDYQTNIATVFSLAKRARDIFDSSEINEKRQFLRYLLQNPTVNEKTLGFTLRSPFNLVLELADNPNWLRG